MPVLASISNITTANTYNELAMVQARGATQASIVVSNAAVFMQLAYAPSPGVLGAFGQEERIIPSLVTMNNENITGIRFRSATPGIHAQIDASLSS